MCTVSVIDFEGAASLGAAAASSTTSVNSCSEITGGTALELLPEVIDAGGNVGTELQVTHRN